MRDRKLERNIARVGAFIESWRELGAYLDTGFRGEQMGDESETGFLELKSSIAREHELIMTTLGSDGERSDRVLRLLSGMPGLGSLQAFEDPQQKRISSEWHALYLSWQALLGRLNGRQIQLASTGSIGVSIRRVFSHPLIIVLLLAAAGYGVYRLAGDLAPKLVEFRENVS
ncbi:hypothetical protein HQ590_04510 [bacterium]|nr:hypothetical protein [bacterium]